MPKVEVLLDRVFTEVSKEEDEILFKCMSKAMRLAKREVIARSPVLEGEYKKGWAVRTKRLKYGFEGVIYNKAKPGLTHLLNNGHDIKNQYGYWGHKNGDHHIEKAHDIAEDYLIDLLVEAHR